MIKAIEVKTVSLPVTSTPAMTVVVDAIENISAVSSDTATVSPLSRQLSECAARAQVRDQSLGRQELGHLAQRLKAQFDTVPYTQSNARHVLPDTRVTDSDLIERDRQAVEYIIRDVQRDPGARNPFAGLSYEQLTLIAYDQGDTFTLNERHAASRAAWKFEERWHMGIGCASQQGAFIQEPQVFYAEHLAHYRGLPLIEQAQYPQGYEAKVEGWMIEAASAGSLKKSDRLLSLFEILAGAIPGKDDKQEEKAPSAESSDAPAPGNPVIKTSN
ncbi:hypothetical protein [Pseudomonas cichorii]|uniref:hypothetical protein n=1 Tax=Pseudomonas cichorii TaxID=36746 RepID=UPI0011C37038|nr:hypothetical protein [Pseudomonas cichorii]